MVGTAQHLRPMLAEPSRDIDINTLRGTHMFDVKVDGVRSIAVWQPAQPQQLVLTNRNGRCQNDSYPEILAAAGIELPPDTSLILDGEIITRSGRFEDIARRDKITRPDDAARAAQRDPALFYAFDLLAMGEVDMRNWPYSKRRVMLEAILTGSGRPHGVFGVTAVSDDPGFLDVVARVGGEGVIAKRADSPYKRGRQSSWLKYKITHSLTCIAVGYEPGEGSRAHFGAMQLAMLDDAGMPVPVGRVGTGFSTDDTWEAKQRLDAGEFFVVEVHVANVTRDGKLRFPSFKGVRTDVDITAATLNQLKAIPRSG